MKLIRIRINYLPTYLIYRMLKNKNKSLKAELQNAIHEYDVLVNRYNDLWLKLIIQNNPKINTENENNTD